MPINESKDMTKSEQIELAHYIIKYIEHNKTPKDAEHFFNAIECFYGDYKNVMISD